MTDKKYLGIWMDHSVAHFVEYTKHSTPIDNEDVTLTQEEKNTGGSENTIQNKENQKQGEFYKPLFW